MDSLPTLPFELRFESLFHQGRGLAFPDERGKVDLNTLSQRARDDFFARAFVGRDFATPTVQIRH